MKKIVAVVALLLVAVFSLGAFAACNQKPDENTLTIEAVNLGFGLDWLYALGNAYTAKHPEIKVNIQPFVGQVGNDTINGHSEAAAGYTDIFVYRPTNYHFNAYQGAVNTSAGKIDCLYADLTDIYTSAYEDGSTMEGKMDAQVANYLKVNGKYYGVNWVDDFMGIVRNKDAWAKLGLTDDDIPVTTNEMFALGDKINGKNQGIAPFIYSKTEEYYTSVWEVWMAQYEGEERMDYFTRGLNPMGEFDENLYSFPGQKVALEVVSRLLEKSGKKYKYQHENSDSLSFTDMQSYFLEGQAALCVNGSWLEIEMNKSSSADKTNYNIDYIRMPVVSDLIKLDVVKNGGVNTDEKLAEVIRYVDATDSGDQSADKPEGVSEEAIARVREARHFSYARAGSDHTMVVAGWSEKIALAKDFIKFMYSDEGMKAYYNAQGGMTLPAKLASGNYDELQLSTFTQSVVNAMNNAYYAQLCFFKAAKVYCLGGVSVTYTNGSGNFVNELLAGKTPDDIINTNKTYLKQNWTSIANKCK